jgi:acetolactate synthase-1/3 small subunit
MTDLIKERAISILVHNKPDVLARIAATFSARGFNIESISANVTRDPAFTKIIITTLSTRETIGRIIKQLNRLVDVLDARKVSRSQVVRREMILARLSPAEDRQAALEDLVRAYGGKVVSLESGSAVLEFTGDRDAIEEVLDRLEDLGMKDLTRTGAVFMESGKS